MRELAPSIPDWVVAANNPEDPFVFVVASTLSNPPHFVNKDRYRKVNNLEGTQVLSFPHTNTTSWGTGFFDYSAVENIYKGDAVWDNFFLMQYSVRNTGMRLSQLKKVLDGSFLDTLNTMLNLVLASADSRETENIIDSVADIVAAYTLEAF